MTSLCDPADNNNYIYNLFSSLAAEFLSVIFYLSTWRMNESPLCFLSWRYSPSWIQFANITKCPPLKTKSFFNDSGKVKKVITIFNCLARSFSHKKRVRHHCFNTEKCSINSIKQIMYNYREVCLTVLEQLAYYVYCSAILVHLDWGSLFFSPTFY